MVDNINPNKDKKSSDVKAQDPNQKVEEKPLSDLAGGGGNSFYRGFSRPDDMKVNLATEHQDSEFREKPAFKPKEQMTGILQSIPDEPEMMEKAEPKPQSPEEPPKPEEKLPPPQAPEKKPEIEQEPIVPPVKLENLSKRENPVKQMPVRPVVPKEPIAWKKVFIIFMAGIVVAVLLIGGTYFGLQYYFNSKVTDKENQLEEVNAQLEKLQQTPASLELPAQEQPTSTAPVTPTVAPTPTPEPATSTPEPQPQPQEPDTNGSG